MIYGNILLTSNYFSISKFAGDRPVNLDADLEHVTSKWWQKKTRCLRFRFAYYTSYDSLLLLDYLQKCDITKPITISDLITNSIITQDVNKHMLDHIHLRGLYSYFRDRKVDAYKISRPGDFNESYDFSLCATNIQIKAELHGVGADVGRFGQHIGDDNCSITSVLQKRITEHNNNVYAAEAVLLLADTVRQERIHEMMNREMQGEDFIELGKLNMSRPAPKHLILNGAVFLNHIVKAPTISPNPSPA